MKYSSIGEYVKAEVIPSTVTTTDAASRLGVARQTLHTFFKGKSKLSPEMATKLESVFGCSAAELVALQVEIEKTRNIEELLPLKSAGYLTISTADIDSWTNIKRVSSRAALPLLIRRLAFATTPDLTELDFHGEEEVERHGWDGETTSAAGSVKVPIGKSCWELSNSAKLTAKPNDDIQARETKLLPSERQEITFIYVTPRRWPAKQNWAKTQRASGKWRDVRAYDADDLSQWLELSVATQIWFAEQIGRSPDGVKSLDLCWDEWTNATDPKLSPRLFENSIKTNASKIDNWLADTGGLPLVVTADSKPEALAWLACALSRHVKESTVVVTSVDALRRTTAATDRSLIVIDRDDVEIQAGPYLNTHRIVVVRTKKSFEKDADIELSQADYDSFRFALEEMGYAHEDVSALSAQTAQSPTILRRHLSKLPTLKAPEWSKEGSVLARKLIPILLAGAWNKSNEWDRMIVSSLAQCNTYEEVERNMRDLLALSDTPVWEIANFKGIVCRRDALFALHSNLLDSDIKVFLEQAALILSEDNPALDLEPEKRWSAAMFGKKREISGSLRQAIRDMLVLLAVHGDELTKGRLGKLAPRIDLLVEQLLLGKPVRNLIALSADMASLAEASPNSFLTAIETDLAKDKSDSQILLMLRPVKPGGFDSPDRIGLLWALETLAWDKAHYPRVIRILTALSEKPIQDNWANTPEKSLGSLVSYWYPETCVEIDGRITALEVIVSESPEVGWRICLAQVAENHNMASPNSRPTYRQIARSGPRNMTDSEMQKMYDAALDHMLSWHAPDATKLSHLVKLADQLSETDQQKLIRMINKWLADAPDKDEKSSLAEELRLLGYSAGKELSSKESNTLKKYFFNLANLLQSNDPVVKHRWLFSESWINESRAELEDAKLNYEERDRRIAEMRSAAIAEVFNVYGLKGILKLLSSGNASYDVGLHLSKVITVGQTIEIVRQLISSDDTEMLSKRMACAKGLLDRDGEGRSLSYALQVMAKNDGVSIINDEAAIRLLQICPCNESTWQILEEQKPNLVEKYWKEMIPTARRLQPHEMQEMVEKLLRAKRPKAAFYGIRFDTAKLNRPCLAKLMQALVTGGNEEPESYQLDVHHLSEAMKHLNSSRALTTDEMASLELVMVGSLTQSEYGIPNLEKKISSEPASFVQLVALVHERQDDRDDPEQFRVPNDVNGQALVNNLYRVLSSIRRTPGSNESGEIDVATLIQWIKEVREQLGALSRVETGDRCIGQLLGKCKTGKDGIWPNEAVRLALEAEGTDKITNSMEVALYNSRGVIVSSRGDYQDRELELKYQTWAEALAPQYPFTARMLRNISDSYKLDAERCATDHSVRKRLGGA
jgi:plasmid maintenance system antidote protein VapI